MRSSDGRWTFFSTRYLWTLRTLILAIPYVIKCFLFMWVWVLIFSYIFKQILTECNNNTCNIWFIKTTLYSKSCKFHVAQVCFRVKIYRIKKENKETICRLLWTRLSYQANVWTILLTMWTNCTTYASVTIQNGIYIFNINSHNIDEYCRSWIEYLNERFQVCIRNRSLEFDYTSLLNVFIAENNNSTLNLYMHIHIYIMLLVWVLWM